MSQTIAYIDGFNLYHRALKGTPYKWLNPLVLCKELLPNDNIVKIRYFTARVSPRTNDPDLPNRQKAYLKALGSIPNIEIHYGYFQETTVRMLLAKPVNGHTGTVEVIKTEEKGSDVNIAAYLLLDAFKDRATNFVIVSNDSDLKTPIQLVRNDFSKEVGILNPSAKSPSSALQNVATFFKTIREPALQAAQFPAIVDLGNGKSITKPKSW